MHLTHRTWVLDDGRDDALAQICDADGVGYLRRDDRRDAKAGNINAALARTTGEYVVVFDADHAPEPDFLLHLLPYFHDADVAFVQSPQHYVNRVNLVSTGAAEAQRIPVDVARAREEIWTPDKESQPTETKLWTPGSKEPA